MKCLASNSFNAIDIPAPGMLYLELNEEPAIPILWLKGFLDPNDPCGGSCPSCCLNTNLFDPNCFKANASIAEISNNPDLPVIEEIISGQGFLNGKWESGYPFFGRLIGQDKRIDPYRVYIIKKFISLKLNYHCKQRQWVLQLKKEDIRSLSYNISGARLSSLLLLPPRMSSRIADCSFLTVLTISVVANIFPKITQSLFSSDQLRSWVL